MTSDDEKYYESLFEMFSLPGWKNFIEDRVVELNRLQQTAHVECTDNESWQVNRGLIFQLEKLINYENMIRNQYDSVVSDSKNEDIQESDY